MLIYSSTINSFLKVIKSYVKDILKNEMNIVVHKQRFEHKGILYPINIVCFEHPNMLGFFNPHAYQIGINRCLLGKAPEKYIKNILRHELCHLFVHITGSEEQAHGPIFRQTAKSFNWDSDVFLASTEMGAQAYTRAVTNETEQRILKKVQKLLQLSQSSNINEAQLATAKANELIHQHNLTILENSQNEDEPEAYVSRVLYAKRNNQKLKSIYEILKYFYVQPVFSYSQQGVYLEVIGAKVHVELTDYMAKFLDVEMERLWNQQRKIDPNLKGMRSKNSFFNGLAQGFIEKIHQSNSHTIVKNDTSLIKMKSQLSTKVDLVYNRLGSSSSAATPKCRESLNIGKKIGKNLNINKAIKNSSQKLLSF